MFMVKGKVVKIGVIGFGSRGRMARYWHDTKDGRSVVVGVADNNPEELKLAKKMFGNNVFLTTNYKDLFKKKHIDAIVVTSPDYCHEEHVTASFRAGKHVFCEKPLSITVESCDKMLSEWKKSGKRFLMTPVEWSRFLREFNGASK